MADTTVTDSIKVEQETIQLSVNSKIWCSLPAVCYVGLVPVLAEQSAADLIPTTPGEATSTTTRKPGAQPITKPGSVPMLESLVDVAKHETTLEVYWQALKRLINKYSSFTFTSTEHKLVVK
ncbi:hypothetical protein Ciccas_002004 [Cichlidogyrus casuarinus]|uniref:Uncharacterized protein n=1 Tax=Cichlidogyrus casuarinus TaxID=1844966 RepID=A0ABD2QIH9_9PLAT